MTKFKEFIKEEARVKENIRNISELVQERSLGMLDAKEVFTIVEDVTKDTEYGYYGAIEGVTRKDTGCGMEPIHIDTPVRTGWWSPVPLRIQIAECYDALEKSLSQWTQVKGIKKLDISDTDFISFLVEQIQGAIYNDFNRLVFFGNKEHSVQGSGSGTQVLKTGVKPDDYNIINGLFTAFEKMCTTDSSKRVTIEENSKTSFAEQLALKPDTAFKAVTALLDQADPLTFASGSSPIILMTHSLATNLARYMRNEYRNELTLSKIEGGYEVSEFEGVKIVTHRWLDQIIKRDFSDGTKWNNPHRALLLDKSECQLGIDSENSLKDIEIEYIGGKEEKVYIKAAYRADFQRVIGTTGAGAY